METTVPINNLIEEVTFERFLDLRKKAISNPEEYDVIVLNLTAKKEDNPDLKKDKKLSVEACSNSITKQVYIYPQLLQHLTPYDISKLTSVNFPEIGVKLAQFPIHPFEEIKAEAKDQIIYYPVNRVSAAQLIKLLFNETSDPINKIATEHLTAGQSVDTVTVSYYLSCIRYFTRLELEEILKDNNFVPFSSPHELFEKEGTGMYFKPQQGKVNAFIAMFHTLFGCYAFCRGTKGKTQLTNWCSTRYNALMNTMQYQTSEQIRPDLVKSGEYLNLVASNQGQLRRIVYEIITKPERLSSTGTYISTHLKFLTAYSGMATYTFVQKAISEAGCILALQPLPSQLIKFLKEQKAVKEKLALEHNAAENLPYLHLLYQNFQCFKSADYPDLVLVAQTLEISQNKDAKENLTRYISKAANRTTLDTRQLRELLSHRKLAANFSDLTPEMIHEVKEMISVDLVAYKNEAQKILKLIQKQRGMVLETEDED